MDIKRRLLLAEKWACSREGIREHDIVKEPPIVQYEFEKLGTSS